MEVGADVNGNMMYQWIVDDGRLNEVAPFVPPPVNPDSSYKSRLRFVRKHDKIDVYIIGRG
jgi:hypothetical protein